MVDPTTGAPIEVQPSTGVPVSSGGEPPVSPSAPDANALPDAYATLTDDGKQLAEDIDKACKDGGALILLQAKALANYAHSLVTKLEASAQAEEVEILADPRVQEILQGAKSVMSAVEPFIEKGEDAGKVEGQSFKESIKAGLKGVESAVKSVWSKLVGQ